MVSAHKSMKGRYIEMRSDGTDPVGSLGARRVPQEQRDWIAAEAARTNRTQRSIIEDTLEAFIAHRKQCEGKYHYEVLPRHEGETFRMFIRSDLMYTALEIVKQDGIYNGDLVSAAIKYAMSKDGA